MHPIERARALLLAQTPMNFDCGRLCGAACCRPDEDGQGGMYLFPGEDRLIDAQSWAQVAHDAHGPGEGGALLLSCDGRCDRAKRPLACMLFPLTPYFRADGQVDVRLDARARPICPLLGHGIGGLQRDFVSAAREAARIIADWPPGARYLADWQAIEQQFRDFSL